MKKSLSMKRTVICSIALGFVSVAAMAQSGTNSPYSQYGIGILSDQSQGFNRGMNGLALGLRYGNQVNSLNPASYSAIDSLSMIFDVGLSGQITNFRRRVWTCATGTMPICSTRSASS